MTGERLTPSQVRAKHADSFNAFWRAFPLHRAREAAFQTFADLVEFKGVDPIMLVEKAKAFAREQGDDLTYCPMAHKWLKDGRYEDRDLFTDQREASREWLRGCYQRCDVAAVEARFHVKMPRINAPDGVEDPKVIAAHYKSQARLWITEMAKELDD